MANLKNIIIIQNFYIFLGESKMLLMCYKPTTDSISSQDNLTFQQFLLCLLCQTPRGTHCECHAQTGGGQTEHLQIRESDKSDNHFVKYSRETNLVAISKLTKYSQKVKIDTHYIGSYVL